MDLSFGNSPLYLILIVLGAGGLTWLMYQGSKDLLPRLPRGVLTAFRFVVLTLIGVLLLQPLITSLTRLSFPPVVVVLQDESESLVVQKDSAFVRETYPGLLRSFLGQFNPDEISVQTYGFASDLRDPVQPDSLRFDQTGTNLAAAIEEVQDLYQNQNLGAIVLVSDGIPTAGVNPLYAIEGMAQPLYSVLLGDTTAQRDVKLQEVLFNEIAYLENEMPVRVKVQSEGFEQAKLTVSLSDGDKVLASKPLQLSRNQAQGEVDFLITPKETGLQRYVVSVSRLENEITYRNNVRTIYVNVLETRVKIALFAGGPHPDVGALREAFKREERYELTEFILKRPGVWYTDPLSYNLEDFDLFILHNFPQSGLDEPIVAKLRDQFKDNKKPAIFFNGMFTNLRTMEPLFDYMALTPATISQKSEEIIADFSTDYRTHSTYTFGEEWIRWANAAPPLYRNQSDWQVKQTAEVFAKAKIKNIPLDYPVFALQSYLGRKNMTFLGENFWRMRAHAFLEGGDFERFDAWLFNTITWLMATDDKRKFRVSPAKPLFSGSEPVIFKGQVYDDSYNPVSGVDIELKLTLPDGKENEYYLNETGNAQYFLELYNLGEGAYSYTAEGRKNNVIMGSDRGQFSIGRSNIEHFRLQADHELMQQLALRTGGTFTYAQDLPALADQIKAAPGLKPVVDFKRQRTPFHEFWWVLVLMLTLLGVEWIVRKRYSML